VLRTQFCALAWESKGLDSKVRVSFLTLHTLAWRAAHAWLKARLVSAAAVSAAVIRHHVMFECDGFRTRQTYSVHPATRRFRPPMKSNRARLKPGRKITKPQPNHPRVRVSQLGLAELRRRGSREQQLEELIFQSLLQHGDLSKPL